MAVELYSSALSLEDVADKLGRSVSGVFKLLKEESFPVRTRKKVDTACREKILRLYYREGLSAPSIAKRLRLAKPTVFYWLERTESPIPIHVRKTTGSNLVAISSGNLDLLPFVEPSHLRWADDAVIVMRIGNSRLAVTARTADAKDFFRVVGFYLAEGSKTGSHASMSNTNLALVALYHRLVLSFVRTEIRTYDIPEKGLRAAKQLLEIGGICLKRLLMNAIEAILRFLGGSSGLGKNGEILGLSFLNGYSEGDGCVTKPKQSRTAKGIIQLRLTEGKLAYARKLAKVVRRILGVGTIYKPRGRNYYELNSNLSSLRAARLLVSGFFSMHPENRRRLAFKALDSVYTSRFVLLYSLFGDRPFSGANLVSRAPGIHADFIGRSAGKRQLIPIGVVRAPRGTPFHWFRSYALSRETQILAQEILKCTGRLGVSSQMDNLRES